jgi:hypothetical protein
VSDTHKVMTTPFFLVFFLGWGLAAAENTVALVVIVETHLPSHIFAFVARI